VVVDSPLNIIPSPPEWSAHAEGQWKVAFPAKLPKLSPTDTQTAQHIGNAKEFVHPPAQTTT
jgi:hypothetical protein